jgi:hypothetical protein
VDHHRKPELGGERELGLEQHPLVTQRVRAVVGVEARLPDRNRPWVGEQRAKLLDTTRLGRCRAVRVDSEATVAEELARLEARAADG